MSMVKHRQVRDYYDHSQWLYQVFCYSSESLGMHYGFWEKGTRNRQEAILNTNRAVIELGKIKKTDRVLDAGCGVGGSAIDIARRTGAHVTGITLSAHQVQLAQHYATRAGLAKRTKFLVGDYHHTKLLARSFDVIYGIESICYADRPKFFKEAYRLLKPSGQLIVIDGYKTPGPKTPAQLKLIQEFEAGFALPPMATTEQITQWLKAAGFRPIKVIPKLTAVKKSIMHFYWLGKLLWWPAWLLHFVPSAYIKVIFANTTAVVQTGEAYRQGIATYDIHVATK